FTIPSETPCAEPHAGCCGGWGLETPGYPIEVVYELPDFASGILFFDEGQGINANALITASNPVSINVHLLRDPSIETDISIVSNDALPEIEFQLPRAVLVGETLFLKAQAEDDLGIAAVEFWLDGQRIGRRLQAPYELSLPVTQDMEGHQLIIWSIAYDSAGQMTKSTDQLVVVEKEKSVDVPSFELEKPKNSQRIVEATPYLLQVASDLGEKDDAASSSGISYVEFFSDGKKIAESFFPSSKRGKIRITQEKSITLKCGERRRRHPISARMRPVSISMHESTPTAPMQTLMQN
ncbi:MAG: hypothetical protein KZQ78_13405, partial [Candidatus Thiodiazotropha sp. (ex Ustalcina ferruginea)]|nr:hypothetical protein [Candidatus Thiodiazotropha sp. (ex Ustalcina ferruginea)]